MTKSAIIFGAGVGLGQAMARTFSREGYEVILVARREQGLAALASDLATDGIRAETISADLAQPGEAGRVVERVAARHGSVDALYYGPTSGGDFVPAAGIGLRDATASVNLLYLGLVSAIAAALPGMRRRGEGVILGTLGGSAALAMPFMSGPGPAMAAARNHLLALHGEVSRDGIFAGMLTLSAIIRGSAYHDRIASGELKMNLPEGFVIPMIDPDDLARRVWRFAQAKDRPEFIYPEQ